MISLKKLSGWGIGLLLSLFANAQQYNFRVNLDTVSAAGFYSIPITSELSSHLKTDFSDFRIVDDKGRWIPHLVRHIKPANARESRIEILKMLSNEILAPTSVLIIENKDRYLLSEFFLRLKNAAAERMTSLSGSDDNKNWFIIADSLLVSRAESFNKDENTQLISFPPTRYGYYKLTIRNDRKDPLNILSVSSTVVDSGEIRESLLENPSPAIKQTDSGKLSLIEITHDKEYQFDYFRMEVKAPALYNRIARVYLELKSGMINTWQTPPLMEINIASPILVNYALPLVKSKKFYVLVANQDNLPLEVTAIHTFQRQKQVVAFLEKNKSYHLLLENPEAKQPDYDLKEFNKNIPDQPQVLATGPIIATKTAVSGTQASRDWWIWATIVVVILILGYLTHALTKDLNKKKEAA